MHVVTSSDLWQFGEAVTLPPSLSLSDPSFHFSFHSVRGTASTVSSVEDESVFSSLLPELNPQRCRPLIQSLWSQTKGSSKGEKKK